MATVTITKDNIDEIIANNDIVFLDFWAGWCRPCMAFAPVFEEASNTYENIVFGKIDTESERELAAAFQIRSIPMLMAFREQIPVFGQPGSLPKEIFEDLIGQVQGLDMADVRKQYEEHMKAQGEN